MDERHLKLLSDYANRDPIRKFVNLLLLQMIKERVSAVSILGNGSSSRILIRGADSNEASVEWEPVPVTLAQIAYRFTFMAGPPAPWWHRLPLWHQFTWRITERIDHWFWKPALATEGRFQLIVNDKPVWVTFRSVQPDRLELNFVNDDAIALE